jgi:hypothetical protein
MRNSFQLANARINTYTFALMMYECNEHPLMLPGKPTVVWIDRAAKRTSANDTVTTYTLVASRCYVTAECPSAYPAFKSLRH